MRKIIPLFCLILLCGCGTPKTDTAVTVTDEPTSGGITVTLPRDDSVNGYRLERSQTDRQSEADNGGTLTSGKYCANKNSMKFHRRDCFYAAKTDPANRLYFNDRDELIRKGYTPCSKCSP